MSKKGVNIFAYVVIKYIYKAVNLKKVIVGINQR